MKIKYWQYWNIKSIESIEKIESNESIECIGSITIQDSCQNLNFPFHIPMVRMHYIGSIKHY